MKKYLLLILSVFFCVSCTTTQYLEQPDITVEKIDEKIEEREQDIATNENNILKEEELKVQDVADTVVYVETPVYIPSETVKENEKKTGYDAVVESQKVSTKLPETYKNGTFFYQFNENLVYEVYAQLYHLTDIILQPGEVVIGTPLISEDETVWELTAGVGKDPLSGLDVQHLFVKPAYAKKDSTMVIITDRRVYHFRLRSFVSTHMAMVKFTYPIEENRWARKKDETSGRSFENDYIRTTDSSLLSFDYKIKYSAKRKPDFIPERVYDDGQRTFIQVNRIVLQKKLPVLFNEKNEIVNYSVSENVFVIPHLINMATLRLGKEKVIIEKCITQVEKGKSN